MESSFATNKTSESEMRAQKVDSHPSTSSASSRSRSMFRIPFLSKLARKKKKNRKAVSKLGLPFTSTPDPSDGEGSVDYQESEYSSQIDLTKDDILDISRNELEKSDSVQLDSGKKEKLLKVDQFVGSNEPMKVSVRRHKKKPKPPSPVPVYVNPIAEFKRRVEDSLKQYLSTFHTNSSQYRLWIIFLVILAAGVLATRFNYRTYNSSSVQFPKFERTNQKITSVICTLLLHADFLWKTKYYSKWDCTQDEAPPLPNQFFVEATWVMDEVEKNLFYVYGTGIEKLNGILGLTLPKRVEKSGLLKKVTKLKKGRMSS
uniref:MSC domain-containing protein n=1 Tax=Syphacia muris TaxID=451379 RepID=A0A0N5AD11_9BILA